MYNILLSVGAGVVVFLLGWLAAGLVAGVIPGVMALVIAWFVFSRRTAAAVQAEMAGVVQALQQQQIDEARERIHKIKAEYGRWQILIDGQLDAQLGMIDYLQRDFAKALPLLESGKWRNWQAQMCMGCIHYRDQRIDEALECFASAESAGTREPMVYVVTATLLTRLDRRSEALEVLARGRQALPENETLQKLQQTVANKKRIDPRLFGPLWLQFFPEDIPTAAPLGGMRGARGPRGPGFPMPRGRRR